jgi:molybdate transport system substrate-binding protein
LVVPKSMPIIFPIFSKTSLAYCRVRAARKGFPMCSAARLISTLLLLNVSALLSSVSAQTKPGILVAAAASLQPLQNQLLKSFSDGPLTFTYGASGSLAQQIRNGAPYDVYLSANELFVKQLADSGHLLKDAVRIYAYGRIAIWSKRTQIRTVADLKRSDVKFVAIANPTLAPYGAAAKAALQNQGIWEALEPKIVYGENVEQTFQYAETGSADAAITAWSLVFQKGGILLPGAWHPRISQSGGVVAASRNLALANKFMAFLTGKDGKAILRQFGFDLPD